MPAEEEQLHPPQRRRTSTRGNCVEAAASAPPPWEELPYVPSHARVVPAADEGNEVEVVPEMPVATLVVGSPDDPSWLRSNFVIPEDEAGLAALCEEIEAVSPPLHNLPFTNRYLSASVGRAALSVVSNLNFLSTIEGVSSN